MSMNPFRKLSLIILSSSLLLIQTSFGFLIHIDVLAKIIPMPNGNEKIDVTIVGSDLHKRGSLENAWQLILDLAEHLNLRKNSVEMFIEKTAASSYFREIPLEIIEFLNRTQVNYLRENRDTVCPGISLLSTFLLLDSTYEEINKIYTKNIDWNNFLSRVKITNLETRAPFDFSQPTKLSPNICTKLLAVFSEVWSTEKLDEMIRVLKVWEGKSHDNELKQLFNDMRKQCSILLNRLKRSVKKNFTDLSTHPKKNSANEIISNIVKKIKSPDVLTDIETLKEATLLQKIFSSSLQYIDLIQAKALWHISQAEARLSNRTITLMGVYHANRSTIPQKITERRNALYRKVDPHFNKDLSLVPSLEKIGYVHLDSISFDCEILDRALQNYNAHQLIDNQDVAAMNDFAAQASEFILRWTNIDDDEVREILTDTSK